VDISINIGDKLGVFFTPHSVGKPDHREVIFGGLKVGISGGKQDVPDTNVGDIAGVYRFQSHPKSEVKRGQSR
jgi:hypothetical protein